MKIMKSRRLRRREDDQATEAHQEYKRYTLPLPDVGRTGERLRHPRFFALLSERETPRGKSCNQNEFFRTTLSCQMRRRVLGADESDAQNETMPPHLHVCSTRHLQPKRTETLR
jgi:hypothetical protein